MECAAKIGDFGGRMMLVGGERFLGDVGGTPGVVGCGGWGCGLGVVEEVAEGDGEGEEACVVVAEEVDVGDGEEVGDGLVVELVVELREEGVELLVEGDEE